MTRLKTTPLAKQDEEHHFLNIAQENLEAGIRWPDALEAGHRHILSHPESGSNRPIPGRAEYAGLQMWLMRSPFQKWVICFLYRTGDDAVEVVRVLHGAEDWERVLAGDA